MLIVSDAEQAVAWYREALGARELWNLGAVAGLEVQGAPFFVHEVNPDSASEFSPERARATSTRVELCTAEPDQLVARALAHGATPGAPVEDHQVPGGIHRQGAFRDPFGHNWSVGDRTALGPGRV